MIIVLLCSRDPLPVNELLSRVVSIINVPKFFPYWGLEAVTVQVQNVKPIHNHQCPSEQLKVALSQYDLSIEVDRDDTSAIICALTSANEAVCALRNSLPKMPLQQQLDIMCHRDTIELKSSNDNTSALHYVASRLQTSM